eukprot:3030950-Prymnesium_polylepis.1
MASKNAVSSASPCTSVEWPWVSSLIFLTSRALHGLHNIPQARELFGKKIPDFRRILVIKIGGRDTGRDALAFLFLAGETTTRENPTATMSICEDDNRQTQDFKT